MRRGFSLVVALMVGVFAIPLALLAAVLVACLAVAFLSGAAFQLARAFPPSAGLGRLRADLRRYSATQGAAPEPAHREVDAQASESNLRAIAATGRPSSVGGAAPRGWPAPPRPAVETFLVLNEEHRC